MLYGQNADEYLFDDVNNAKVLCTMGMLDNRGVNINAH